MPKNPSKWRCSFLLSCSIAIASEVILLQSGLGNTLGQSTHDSDRDVEEILEPIIPTPRGIEPRPRLLLVHNLEEMQKEWGKEQLSPSAKEMTRMFEKAAEGTIKEKIHADQHELLLRHKENSIKIACVELLAKLRRMDRKIEELRKAGHSDKAEQLEQQADKSHALAQVICRPEH